jgi:outer membrane protein
MKKILVAAFIVLMAQGTWASAAVVGVVNIQKVMAVIKEGKAVDKKLKSSFLILQKKLKKEEGKIKKEQDAFKKQSLVLSDKAKMEKQMSFQKKVRAFQEMTVKYQKQIQKEEANLKKPIFEKLRLVIEKVSAKENVDLTIEQSASPLLYVKNKKDLNPIVIKAYNKKYSK